MKRLGDEPRENARARGYAAKFEAEHPGEAAADDVMTDTFAACVVVPPVALYPAIRQQLEVIRHEKAVATTTRPLQQPQAMPTATIQPRPTVDVHLPGDGAVL